MRPGEIGAMGNGLASNHDEQSLPRDDTKVEVAGEAPKRGLALADPGWPVDLRRLFPGEDLRVEMSSKAFAKALVDIVPDMVILVAPPASPVDLRRVSSWMAKHGDSSAVLLTPLQSAVLQLSPILADCGQPGSDGSEASTGDEPSDRIALGRGIEFDRRAGVIKRDDKLLSLRPKEAALLDLLASYPARVFSRKELLRHVWHDSAPSVRTVDVHIFWLRAKVERNPADPTSLLTVRGHGYVFDPPFPTS